MGVFGFLRRHPHERTGHELYAQAVAAARDPYLYATVGVPTRWTGVSISSVWHACLVIRHLQGQAPPGPALARRCSTPCSTTWMSRCAKLGVGDLSVGKR